MHVLSTKKSSYEKNRVSDKQLKDNVKIYHKTWMAIREEELPRNTKPSIRNFHFPQINDCDTMSSSLHFFIWKIQSIIPHPQDDKRAMGDNRCKNALRIWKWSKNTWYYFFPFLLMPHHKLRRHSNSPGKYKFKSKVTPLEKII